MTDNINMDEVVASMDQTPEIKKGNVIEGTIVLVDKDGIMVDIGAKSEAKIPMDEISDKEKENLEENFRLGDVIKARVIQPSGKEGIILSKKSLDYELRWDDIQKIFDSKEVVKAVVKEANKGGLRVDLLGYSAFCPNSQVWGKREGNKEDPNNIPYAGKVGETLEFEVKELDKVKHKIILSNKDVVKRKKDEEEKAFWNSISEGQIVDGIVKNITEYGAFVDLSGDLEGSFDGLLHKGEMSWNKINSPKDLFKKGDRIQVYIKEIKREEGKISLSLKQIQEDPWESIPGKYPVDSVFTGKVTRVAPKCAFVDLGDGCEGILPISEISLTRIEKVSDVVKEGDEVTVKVISLSDKERKVALSMKQIALDLKDEEDNKIYDEQKSATEEVSSFSLGEIIPDDF